MAIYMLVAVGTIDDRLDLPANSRLVAQTCAALLVTLGAEMVVTSLGAPLFFDLKLGFLGPPFTLVFIVTVINGYNVIDGLDGLAGGLGLFALGGLAIVGIGTPMFALAVMLAAVVAAFLVFNLPLTFNRPFRAFMGDAGSTSLGLGIACIGIALSQGMAPAMSPVVGLWLIAVPVFEFFATIIRRVVNGASPLVPDHFHLHHTLVLNGLSRRSTLAAMLAFGFACAGIGIAAHLLEIPDGALMLAWFAAGALYYGSTRQPRIIVAVVQLLLGRPVPPVSRVGEP
jgi:UDP-GlcNAc:undecaprenyl-phosphate GlcNAc-1-phosphate transferase